MAILTIAIISLMLGIAMLFAAMKSFAYARVLRALILTVPTMALLAGGGLGLIVGSLVYAWEPVPADARLASVTVRDDENRQFIVSISRPEQLLGEPYLVPGAKWYIIGKLVQFREPFSGFGFEPLYRLEKIAGGTENSLDPIGTSFKVIEQAEDIPGFVHKLAGMADRLPWLASFTELNASGPMADGNRFILKLENEQIVSTPILPAPG